MWTSLCNFFCRKLFHGQDVNSRPRNQWNECIYGKRLKLSDGHCGTNSFSSNYQTSMQKENIKNNNDEEECCVIAEIPKRKKAGSSPKSPYFCPLESNKEARVIKITLADNNKEDKDIQMVKCTGSSGNKQKLSKSLNKSQKFFSSQRSSLSQSKLTKSRLSFKNHLKKSMNFLQESYRLTEKIQYMQLLQSHTTYNLSSLKPTFKSLTYNTKVIPVIDLTDDTSCGSSTEKSDSQSSEDQEVQIVGEVPGIRSFQDILKITPVDTSEAVKNLLCRRAIENSDLPIALREDTISLLDDDDDGNEGSQKTSPEELEEKLRAFMKITTSKQQEEIKPDYYSLPEITSEQEEKIHKAFVLHPSNEVLAEGFGLSITRRDIQTLFGLNWINDEIINFYMNLITKRSELNANLPKVYAFNTFFYPKLVTCGYMSLRRWTKRVDIFSYDVILVPIHLGMHWCMSVIDFRQKTVRYYDSVGSPNDVCLERLLLYLRAESLDKKNKLFSTNHWEKRNVEDVPQQMNGSDCGVFSCMFAEHIARNCGIFFSQDDMPYFRKKMVIEILEKKLLT